MRRLTDIYRPRTFEELVGQEQAAAWCAHQVVTHTAKSAVLLGPTGTGKTTLARIYAKALLCPKVSATGSPCGHCKSCQDFGKPGETNCIERNCAETGRFEDMERLLEVWHTPAIFGGLRVTILDEVHQLSPKAFDAMLTVLEEPQPWSVFLLLTTEASRIPRTILSRCAKLELNQINPQDAITHLRHICEKEDLSYEPEALSLLAEASHGHVRNLVQNLEQVADGTRNVCANDVRKLLRLEYVDALIRYLRAVLNNDLESQFQALDRWLDPAAKKAHVIHELLVFLFTNDVLHLRRTSGIMKDIQETDRAWIAGEMQERAKALSMDLRQFWQAAVDFWGSHDGEITDAKLAARVTRFDELLNVHQIDRSGLATQRTLVGQEQSGQSDIAASRHSRVATVRRQSSRGNRAGEREALYLSKSQVRQLWDAASVLVQEYGELLNTRLVVAHYLLGMTDPADGVQLISDLTHELGMALRRWAGSPFRGFHWLYVHELAPNFRTTVAAVIPSRHADEVEHWIIERFFLKRFGGPLPPGAIRIRVLQPSRDIRRLQLHLQLVRMLCRSVDPSIQVLDRGERRSLSDVLSLSTTVEQNISSPLVMKRRLAVSHTIGKKAQTTMRASKLAPLSPFGDGAWAHLGTGWELTEHQDREREKQERRAAEAIIKAHWPAGGGILQDVRLHDDLNRLMASWPENPHHRARTWQGWW